MEEDERIEQAKGEDKILQRGIFSKQIMNKHNDKIQEKEDIGSVEEKPVNLENQIKCDTKNLVLKLEEKDSKNIENVNLTCDNENLNKEIEELHENIKEIENEEVKNEKLTHSESIEKEIEIICEIQSSLKCEEIEEDLQKKYNKRLKEETYNSENVVSELKDEVNKVELIMECKGMEIEDVETKIEEFVINKEQVREDVRNVEEELTLEGIEIVNESRSSEDEITYQTLKINKFDKIIKSVTDSDKLKGTLQEQSTETLNLKQIIKEDIKVVEDTKHKEMQEKMEENDIILCAPEDKEIIKQIEDTNIVKLKLKDEKVQEEIEKNTEKDLRIEYNRIEENKEVNKRLELKINDKKIDLKLKILVLEENESYQKKVEENHGIELENEIKAENVIKSEHIENVLEEGEIEDDIIEEEDNIEECTTNEIFETKDFSEELVDFPQIIQYIKNLENKIKCQQDTILILKKKLVNYEKYGKVINDSISNQKMQSDSSDSAMTQAGFVYEKTTGLYYHSDSGYYYDTKSGLYYNGNTGTYYYYDKENGVYKFHSQVQSEAVQGNQQIVPNITEKGKKRRKKKKERLKKIKLMEGEEDLVKEIVEVENADCKDSQSNIKEDSSISCSSSDSESKIDEDIAEDYPPCMRIIVKETSLSNLKIGSLFIVAYTGGSIGREGDHLVIIPDINISKHHAKLQYNEEKKVYELIDLGSRNGTFLNGKRLSAAKQESEPSEIVHGSILQLGFTKLLCHVHSGYKTCGHCEPGLVQTDSTTEDNNFSLKSLHKSELKRLKNKYGINNDNTKSASRVASGYHDRAQSRREYIGSSSHHTKTQQSDIHQSISKDNTGFKMLEKMGWKEGESLGKSGVGLTEPLMVTPVINKAGLGSSDQNVQIDPSVEKKQAIWRKTQIRFNEIDD